MKNSFKLIHPGKQEHKRPVKVELTDNCILVRKGNYSTSELNNNLRLSANGLPATNVQNDRKSDFKINLTDVVGAHRMKGNSVSDISGYFAVYSYPAISVGHSLRSRVRHVHTFQVSDSEDNFACAAKWVAEIRNRLKRPFLAFGNGESVLRKHRCLYALVNPHSGPGKALEMFQNHVVPVLAEANTICKLVITEQANHAKQLAQKLDLSLWDGVVIVSGDGLIFEVLNGFMLRDDREDALKLPIGIVPGGSGNALASAVCYATGESVLSNFAMQMAVMIARPFYSPMKLVHVETDTEHMACFMGVAWGLISDVDIESERYRRILGGSRFTCYSLVRIAKLRKYRGRISYLKYQGAFPRPQLPRSRQLHPADPNSEPSNLSPTLFKDESSETNQRWDSAEDLPHGFTNVAFSSAELEAGQDTLDHLKLPSASEKISGPSDDQNDLQVQQSNASPYSAEYRRQREFWSSKHSAKGIPGISEPVPGNWTVIEDDFVFVVGGFLSHLSEDILYLPNSQLDDGIIYLTLVRGSLSRVQLAQILFGFSSGEHVKHDLFEMIPVVSFRLEPLGEKKGILTADGEALDTTKLQVSVTSYRANVMTQ